MRINVLKKEIEKRTYNTYKVEILKNPYKYGSLEECVVILLDIATYDFVCSFKFGLNTGVVKHLICDTTINEQQQIAYIVGEIGKKVSEWKDCDL